jgi:hypothetical protein
MLVEVSDDDMFFSVIARTGCTVDSGVIHRAAAGEKRFDQQEARGLLTTGVRGPTDGR